MIDWTAIIIGLMNLVGLVVTGAFAYVASQRSSAAVNQSKSNEHKIDAVHISIDGRMDELLASARSAARMAGIVEGGDTARKAGEELAAGLLKAAPSTVDVNVVEATPIEIKK